MPFIFDENKRMFIGSGGLHGASTKPLMRRRQKGRGVAGVVYHWGCKGRRFRVCSGVAETSWRQKKANEKKWLGRARSFSRWSIKPRALVIVIVLTRAVASHWRAIGLVNIFRGVNW